jgi:hypothetical protein
MAADQGGSSDGPVRQQDHLTGVRAGAFPVSSRPAELCPGVVGLQSCARFGLAMLDMVTSNCRTLPHMEGTEPHPRLTVRW